MIKRLLIANRGEIAVRIIHACRELGIQSVAVYSEADRDSLHVAVADRQFAIGPAAAIDSYLSVPAILAAAKATGADAIHPGYGFLSEHAGLARGCEESGLNWVGPPSDVIARMGSKIQARQLMERAGVPVVPGEAPIDQSDSGIRAAAIRVGLPVLIKASAGGGGKAMRRVTDAHDIVPSIQSARREAVAAFDDGTLFVERLVERPRHVEVQIFGDADGRIVHLFERECSVQRRHQKVIEETPSPALTPAVRERIVRAAIQAAAAVGYRNAGTVEFLFDDATGDEAGRFYFLEMNTRLQVEHAITELVCGVDLVHAQLLVAAGRPLPWQQEQISQRGHAIEARVYAEDPDNGFLPQPGRLLLYREPRMPGVRVDSGVREGDLVSPHYDPLLAKVIASGETRDAALSRLETALREYPILGVRTNLPYLLRVLAHPRFRAGQVDTGLLQDPSLAPERPASGGTPPPVALAVAAHAARRETGATTSRHQNWDPWTRLPQWRG
jgi:acetyl-CoA carboxylase biotin carboxylase subunit